MPEMAMAGEHHRESCLVITRRPAGLAMVIASFRREHALV
jgi:hypothetical protein